MWPSSEGGIFVRISGWLILLVLFPDLVGRLCNRVLHLQILQVLVELAIIRVLQLVGHPLSWLLVHIAIIVILLIHLIDLAHRLLVLHLEICLLRFLDLPINPINLKLVGLDLGLVVFKFEHHLFELLAPLFEVLLVYDQFLSNLGATLLCKNVFQLNVELLFLLDKNILL